MMNLLRLENLTPESPTFSNGVYHIGREFSRKRGRKVHINILFPKRCKICYEYLAIGIGGNERSFTLRPMQFFFAFGGKDGGKKIPG